MSMIDDCAEFLEDLILGDFNEQQMVSAQVVGGLVSLIPVMDQVLDARDVSGCLYRINKRGGLVKATLDDKVDLGFSAIGLVPAVGSAFKTIFKPLYRQRKLAKGAFSGGVAVVERMLGANKGGAVRWIKTLDWAGTTQAAILQADAALESCIAMLEYIGQSHWWCPDRLARLANDVVPSLRAMRGKLAAPIRDAMVDIRAFLEETLGEHAAAVAMAAATSVSSGPRSNSPSGRRSRKGASTQHEEVAQIPRSKVSEAAGNILNAVQPTAFQLYAPLDFALKGLMGEHIVEHYVIEKKGWGMEWNQHDCPSAQGKKSAGWQSPYRKLNDAGMPVSLCTPKGHVLRSGIDSAWLTKRGGNEEFAIVEAKASMNPQAELLNLLGESNAEQAPVKGKRDARSKARRGTRARASAQDAQHASTSEVKGTSEPAHSERKKILQMSHAWVAKAIARELLEWRSRMAGHYTRHVMLVTPLQAAEHIRAFEEIKKAGLLEDPSEAQQFAHLHCSHDIHKEFRDAEIDAAEKKYAASGKPIRKKQMRKKQ